MRRARAWPAAAVALGFGTAACTALVGVSDLSSSGGDGDASSSHDAAGRPDGPAEDVAAEAGADAASGDGDGDARGDGDGGVIDEAAPPDADGGGCPSVIAFVGGNTTKAFAATLGATGKPLVVAWATANLVEMLPSVVALRGGGFHALLVGPSGAVNDTAYDPTARSWATPTTVPSLSAYSPVTLVATASTLYASYLGSASTALAELPLTGDAGGGWATGPSPGIPNGSAQPAMIVYPGTSADLLGVFPEVQMYGGTQVESVFSAAATEWTTANGDFANGPGTPPSLVALSGGKDVALFVWPLWGGGSDFVLQSMVLDRTGTWSAPALVAGGDAAALGYTDMPMQLVPLSGGRALLAYEELNSGAKWTIFDGSGSWSPPATFPPSVGALPSLATGVCGDDAVAVVPPTATGDAQILRLHGNTWSAPQEVAGTFTGSSVTAYAAIATQP